MYPNSTNGAEAAQVELSNGPELKVLDFDKDTDEFAQFAVAFPKSWNAGTVTFQAFLQQHQQTQELLHGDYPE